MAIDDEVPPPSSSAATPPQAPTNADGFNEDLVRKYPRSNRKIAVDVAPYGLMRDEVEGLKAQTIHISPHGMEFQGNKDFPEGTLLKIHISLPDYWVRKQRFVDYRRVDTPGTFKMLGKVVRTEDVGKRGKKKLIVVQTVNMDEVDEQVLKSYLQDG